MATIPIYILAGQSNAHLFGVDNAIESTLNKKGVQFELVKTAVSGSQVFVSPGLDDWNVESGELYTDLVNNVKSAIANIEAQGHTASIDGMLWIQGEADAGMIVKANDYEANLTNLINQLRSDLGQGDFEVILSELSEHSKSGAAVGGNPIVRSTQEDVAANLNNVVILETSDLTFIDDVHYDVASRETIAERFIDEDELVATNVDFVAENAPTLDGDNEIVLDFFDNEVEAGLGNDTINAFDGDDYLNGNEGDDKINGGTGEDTIYGGTGDDTINGGSDNDTIEGQFGNDLIIGGAGDDLIFAGAGNDLIAAGDDEDLISGAAGHDTIDTGAGDDQVFGGLSNDLLLGNLGDDVVVGGVGNDTVFGGEGNDTIEGGSGDDTLRGDAGDDIFVFKLEEVAEETRDFIQDFSYVDDQLLFLGFENLTTESFNFEALGNGVMVTAEEMIGKEIYLQNFDIDNVEQIDILIG